MFQLFSFNDIHLSFARKAAPFSASWRRASTKSSDDSSPATFTTPPPPDCSNTRPGSTWWSSASSSISRPALHQQQMEQGSSHTENKHSQIVATHRSANGCKAIVEALFDLYPQAFGTNVYGNTCANWQDPRSCHSWQTRSKNWKCCITSWPFWPFS